VNPEEEKRNGSGGKDMQKRKVLRLKSKSEWAIVIVGNSKYDSNPNPEPRF